MSMETIYVQKETANELPSLSCSGKYVRSFAIFKLKSKKGITEENIPKKYIAVDPKNWSQIDCSVIKKKKNPKKVFCQNPQINITTINLQI